MNNLLNILRNSSVHQRILLPFTKNNFHILLKLEKEGFLILLPDSSFDSPEDRQRVGNPHSPLMYQSKILIQIRAPLSPTLCKGGSTPSIHTPDLETPFIHLVSHHTTAQRRCSKVSNHTTAQRRCSKVSSHTTAQRRCSGYRDLSSGSRFGLGCLILKTSKGILTDREAISHRVGGQLLFKI